MSNETGALVKTIAILGGTGKEGSALARRWALQGYRVLIGSRDAGRAQETADTINAELGDDFLSGHLNEDAAEAAEIVVLSVPYKAHRPTLESVKAQVSGKILVDVTVPITPPDVSTVTVPAGTSAAQEAQAFLGDDVRVVSAFQNVSYTKINDPDSDANCDVLITGDDQAAKDDVMTLVEAAGMRGVDAGPLANAIVAESITPMLIYINKKYGSKGAGIRITNVDLS